jgi:hypothetical protein
MIRRLFAELSKAPLKDLELCGWSLPSPLVFSNYLKSLQHLQTLCFSRCAGMEVIIPGIASLGRLIMNSCSFSQLSIEEPTISTANISFPIYYLFVDCRQVNQINVCRPISLMKIENVYPGLKITGTEFVKELVHKSSFEPGSGK